MKTYKDLLLARDTANRKLQKLLQEALVEIEKEFQRDFGVPVGNLRLGISGSPLHPTFAEYKLWVIIDDSSDETNSNKDWPLW